MKTKSTENPSLAVTHPDLSKEWHPSMNGNLTPRDVTSGSHKKVWWYKPYDDPVTGKHFDFEWQAEVKSRALFGCGCPYTANKAVWTGYNDLATTHPDLVKEWHPTKNGSLSPCDVSAGSNKTAWWYMPYDDPVTGRHYNFEWEALIYKRTINNAGCPYLTGQAIWPGYNDLATTHPDLSKEWHPSMNGDLTPHDVTSGCHKKVWWYKPYDDPVTGKHFDFVWQAVVKSRAVDGCGCPYTANKAVWPGYNDLATTRPDLKTEWHPTKNGILTPENVMAGSNVKVWWWKPYDDPATGKHFDFVWQATINNRTINNTGCPYLTGQAVWPGYNDLATTHPDLAKEWHPSKNGNLTPADVTYGSGKKVWWLILYEDPETGDTVPLEWQSPIMKRAAEGHGCPYLSGSKVLRGFNDLAECRPDIAAEWHPDKNGILKPEDVTIGSNLKVWWLKPYDDPATGQHFEFEWETTVKSRTIGGCDCPFLTNTAVWTGYNDLATTHPDLAKEWHPTKNGDLTPSDVTAGSEIRVWWYLPYTDPSTGKTFEFEWYSTIASRTIDKTGCPYFSNLNVWPGYNDLKSQCPKIASEWDPGNLTTPEKVLYKSNDKYWWICPKCGHRYYMAVSSRTLRGSRCQLCRIKK